MISAYSTQATTQTTQGSSKGFVSFSSQSLLESSMGPNIVDRLVQNISHLSTNLNRFTVLPSSIYNVSVIIKILQLFSVFIMPSAESFWYSSKSSKIIVQIFTFFLHLSSSHSNKTFYQVLGFILFTYFFIHSIYMVIILMKNPRETSLSNKHIWYILISNISLVQILFNIVFSTTGNILHHVVFGNDNSTLMIFALIFDIITCVLVYCNHFLSYILIKNAARIRYDVFCRPFAAYVKFIYFFELYLGFIAFLEEFLPVDKQLYTGIFSLFGLVLVNPYTSINLLTNPVFNNFSDAKYMCTIYCTSFINLILHNIRFFAVSIYPTTLFTITVFSFIFFYYLFDFLTQKIISHNLMKLYSVYKQSNGVLPPTSPFIFNGNHQNQVPLSQEAYNVVQGFNSLEIETAREFKMIASIGACKHMPAVRNFDFIRWGIQNFYDDDTLFICAQICNHFRENAQTQTVLLQYLSDNATLSVFTKAIIHVLEFDHTDVISDNPLFLKILKTKALAAQARCRKCTSLFWSCVLNHSLEMMKNSLCRLRDAASEAQTHFDELMRCYPLSLDAISLYMSFMFETKAEFVACYRFLNETSSKFIELKSDGAEYGGQIDSMSVLLKDTNRSYSKYIAKINAYQEQERQIRAASKKPAIIIWSFAIIAFLFIVGFTAATITISLLQFNTYPSLLEMINTGSDLIIELASLSLAARRLCLFSSGVIDYVLPQGEIASQLDSLDSLKDYMKQQAAVLPRKINAFFITSSVSQKMIETLTKFKTNVYLFDQVLNASLSTTIELLAVSIRTIITNIPSYYDDDGVVNDTEYSSICSSFELRILAYNIKPISILTTNYITVFENMVREEIEKLDKTLFYAMIIQPVAFVVVFGIVLWIICRYIEKESLFRMTLYLSFPEQVASSIVHSISLLERKQIEKDGSSYGSGNMSANFSQNITSGRTKRKGNQSLNNNDDNRSKAVTIESLYQFSTMLHGNSTTGRCGYAISMIIFLLIGGLSLFSIAYFARSINASFTERSTLLCNSAQRFSALQYATMLTIEAYNSENENLVLFTDDMLRTWATEFLDDAVHFNKVLTYGNKEISLDYSEYPEIEELFNGQNSTEDFYHEMINPSYSLMSHEGYKKLGLESRIQLLIVSTKGILQKYTKDRKTYNPKSKSWLSLNHLLLLHIIDDLRKTTSIYFDGVNNVISHSYSIAIVISLSAVGILLIIFVGPILSYSISLVRYFTFTTQLVASVPPEVFERTVYIHKWLQGRINRYNYKQFEASFKRTVSPELQQQISRKSPEKILLFSIHNEFIDLGSIELEPEQDKSLSGLLSIFFDLQKETTLIDSIQRAFIHFQDAKDKTDNYVIMATSRDGVHMSITLTGITSADSAAIVPNEIQMFYAFVAILIKDVTKEKEDEDRYQEQRASTLALLETIIPRQIAERIHNGERSVQFSAGIGTIITAEVSNYYEILKIGADDISMILSGMRNLVSELVQKYLNISPLYVRNGKACFIAGMFNDEQNGQTEATDTLNFTFEFHKLFRIATMEKGMPVEIKYGMATGGPIYCKLIMEGAPIALVDGEVYDIAERLLQIAKPFELVFEKTTLECASSTVEMDPVEAESFDHNDRFVQCYKINVNDHVINHNI